MINISARCRRGCCSSVEVAADSHLNFMKYLSFIGSYVWAANIILTPELLWLYIIVEGLFLSKLFFPQAPLTHQQAPLTQTSRTSLLFNAESSAWTWSHAPALTSYLLEIPDFSLQLAHAFRLCTHVKLSVKEGKRARLLVSCVGCCRPQPGSNPQVPVTRMSPACCRRH